jgi:predicted ATPase/class 3 adenylate cyclase
VTFLFTDLEGSTRLWEEHSDDMRVALARHDEILRKTVEAHDGAIVKTTGDGLHAAFATADHALAAAVDAQLALTGEVWPLPEPLRVRMGIHTGAAEERDGDYYGPAVNRAARVAAAAHGGQILVSHASEELGRDTLPSGATLIDLGEHRLRDLARAERVFQLAAPGLTGDFAPPRTADAYPGNLPVQLSTFVGREHDVRAITDALCDARLITLTGVGGVGKTRLATQVAAELLPHFPDGAWLCELAPATDGDALEQVVVAALGITPRAGTTLRGSIVEFLAAKHLLIVLDNCEHLLDDAGNLAESILRECPGVTILATSREGLGVEGEHLRVVRSLALPTTTDAAEIAATAAGQLFVERARAAHDDLGFDDDAMVAVAEICRRLDGIPLAIELAAARVGALAPGEIAQRLDERFRLLTGGRRTAVERHHTLRATVDWSYSLLDERERVVFDRLGAFSGSFDSAAAGAVASDHDIESWDVVDAITDLVAKSMVVREPGSTTTRYTLLETMRQYALERLDEHDDADAVRRRHAQHYVTTAQQMEAGLYGPDELASRARVGDDLDNLRAAVTWGLDRADPHDRELALLIIAHLALETSLDRTTGVGSWALRGVQVLDDVEPWIRSAVLGAAAEDLRTRAEYIEAARLADDALRDGVRIRGAGPALALMVRVIVKLMLGRGEEGLDEALADMAIMREAGVRYEFASAATVVSSVAGFVGRFDDAEAVSNEAFALAEAMGSPTIRTGALYARGNAIDHDEPEEALRCYEECIAICHDGASKAALGPALGVSALLWHRLGDSAMGLDRAIESVEHMSATGDRSTLGTGLGAGAVIAYDLGEDAMAVTLFAGARTVGSTDAVSDHDPRWRATELREPLRERIGREAYDRLWNRVAAMSIDQIVAEGLADMRNLREQLAAKDAP